MELKLFGKWDWKVEVKDPGLKKYINLTPVHIPRTFGRFQKQRFYRSKMNIVERLINKLMTPGHRGKKHKLMSRQCTGKWSTCVNLVKKAFEYIEKKEKRNPIEVLVRAIERVAPREEITTIEIGGIRYPKAVDVAPQRRVDLALRWITQAAFHGASRKKKKAWQALAEELIYAARGDATRSNALKKKIEVERQAAASR